jgi:hypothetical protein
MIMNCADYSSLLIYSSLRLKSQFDLGEIPIQRFNGHNRLNSTPISPQRGMSFEVSLDMTKDLWNVWENEPIEEELRKCVRFIYAVYGASFDFADTLHRKQLDA